MKYSEFVREKMLGLRGSTMTATEKFKHIAREWREMKGQGGDLYVVNDSETGGRLYRMKKKLMKGNPAAPLGGVLESSDEIGSGGALHRHQHLTRRMLETLALGYLPDSRPRKAARLTKQRRRQVLARLADLSRTLEGGELESFLHGAKAMTDIIF